MSSSICCVFNWHLYCGVCRWEKKLEGSFKIELRMTLVSHWFYQLKVTAVALRQCKVNNDLNEATYRRRIREYLSGGERVVGRLHVPSDPSNSRDIPCPLKLIPCFLEIDDQVPFSPNPLEALKKKQSIAHWLRWLYSFRKNSSKTTDEWSQIAHFVMFGNI